MAHPRIDWSTKSVTAVLPSSPKGQEHTNSPNCHVMKLLPEIPYPPRLLRIIVEWAIQPFFLAGGAQTIWWTSYVFFIPRGALARGTGVYTEWSEFGSVSSHPTIGIINLRPENIKIIDIAKGAGNRGGLCICSGDPFERIFRGY